MFKKIILKPEAQKKIAESSEYYEKRLIEFRNLTKENLIASTKYYMSQMQEPKRHQFSTPTYDAVFWYIIMPEIIKRLSDE